MKRALVSLALAGCDQVFLGERHAPELDASNTIVDMTEPELCLVAHSEPRLPVEAQAICAQAGLRLVEITTPVRNAEVKAIAPQSALIGLFDLDEDGTFSWASGSALAYRNFAAGQPDDQNNTQACVIMIDGSWFDYDCTPMPFICECAP